jgi:hypothetical protein
MKAVTTTFTEIRLDVQTIASKPASRVHRDTLIHADGAQSRMTKTIPYEDHILSRRAGSIDDAVESREVVADRHMTLAVRLLRRSA